MTVLYCNTTQQRENARDTIKELRHAIQENTHKLEKVQQKRLSAEEEIIRCTKETERRVELMMEKIAVVDALQQLGHLLQEEKQFSEELNSQTSAESYDLQERSERVTNKARGLAAEILEVQQRLAEAKARNANAQVLINAPASKSRRAQNKSK